jgi:hypothetical protein
MATTSSPKPSAAFNELGKTLGSKPPKGLAKLSAADLKHLNQQIAQSLEHHQASMAEAEETIINQAPKPLRKTVRKILGA